MLRKRFFRVCAALVACAVAEAGLWYMAGIVYLATAGSEYADAVTSFLMLTGNVCICVALFYYRYKTRPRWIREEVSEWLKRRSRKNATPPSIWTRRLRRCAPWVPSAIVLLAFLFFPEALGIASHILQGRSVTMNPYRLEIPLTSIIVGRSDSYLWVVSGKGIGRVGFGRYWRKDEPTSSMEFSYNPDLPRLSRLAGPRTVPFGRGRLACWEADRNRDYFLGSTGPDSTEIYCANAKDFGAHFSGARIDASTFYEVLRQATEVK
jgi:hypothetical protein